MSDQNVPKSATEWLPLLAGLVGIGLVSYFVFRVTGLFLDFLARVNPAVGAAIIASMTTILVGIGGALITQYQIKKRQAEESHREEKIKLYGKFIDMAASNLAQENENLVQRKIPQKELVNFFFQFKQGLILRGSADVIHAMAKFEGTSEAGGDIMASVDDIYRAIRKDVGLSNRGLKKYELVAIYLKSEDRNRLVR